MHAMQRTEILHIEDDDLDALAMSRMLANSPGNYELAHAKCLAEALEMGRANKYRVYIVDYHLPDANGRQAIEKLVAEFPDSVIISHSGSLDEALHLEAIQYGAVDYLCKRDLNPETIHRCIQQNLLRLAQAERIQELLRCVNEQHAEVEKQAAQLREQNRRLERLNDTSRKFVNNVSHEFRTPLCVIKQYSSLIGDQVVGSVNPQQQKLLRTIEDRVDDLNNMVDDMLDVSRIESGMLAAHRDRTEIENIFVRVLPPLRQRAHLRGVEITETIDEGLPQIFCDAEKASRTLINLVSNAIKFSPNGSVVRVRAAVNEESRDVVVSVEDEGIGIPEVDFQALFQRFRQGEQGTASSTKGFGLGLHIARELAELNLGELGLASEVGVGSRFWFTLPAADNWEIAKRFLLRIQDRSGHWVQLISLRLSAEQDQEVIGYSDEVHVFLNQNLRRHEALLSTGEGQWLMLLAENESFASFTERFMRQYDAHNRNRPQGDLPQLLVADRGCYSFATQQSTLKDVIANDSQSAPPSDAWLPVGLSSISVMERRDTPVER